MRQGAPHINVVVRPVAMRVRCVRVGRANDYRWLLTQSATPFGSASSEKRRPSFQAPGFFASFFRFVALSPIGELIDVQNVEAWVRQQS